MTSRLTAITARHQKSFVRDVLFTVAVALATVVSAASVQTAVAASTSVAQR